MPLDPNRCMACMFQDRAEQLEKECGRGTPDLVAFAYIIGATEAHAIAQGRIAPGFIFCAEHAKDFKQSLEARGCDLSRVKCFRVDGDTPPKDERH